MGQGLARATARQEARPPNFFTPSLQWRGFADFPLGRGAGTGQTSLSNGLLLKTSSQVTAGRRMNMLTNRDRRFLKLILILVFLARALHLHAQTPKITSIVPNTG